MKTLMLLLILCITHGAFAQTHNDTLYYRSGEARVVNVVKETNRAIVFEYENGRGKAISSRVRKSMINAYAILDENNTLIKREENPNARGKDPKPTEAKKRSNRRVGLIFLGVVGAAALAYLTIGFLSVL